MDEFKTTQDSASEQSIIITYEHINGAGRLFGGRLAEWIDNIGGITARRHCSNNVTTASLDIDFFAPAFVNDTVTLKSRVVYTGNTSLLVSVDVFCEYFDKPSILIAQGHLVFVGVDDNGKPVKTYKIKPLSPQEIDDYRIGEERIRLKKEIRKNSGK